MLSAVRGEAAQAIQAARWAQRQGVVPPLTNAYMLDQLAIKVLIHSSLGKCRNEQPLLPSRSPCINDPTLPPVPTRQQALPPQSAAQPPHPAPHLPPLRG